MAQQIYHGQEHLGRPIMNHAVSVATIYESYVDPADAEIFAGLLLHDTPEYVDDMPSLYKDIEAKVGNSSLAVVQTIATEQHYLAQPNNRQRMHDILRELATNQPSVAQAMVADKIVSISGVLAQAAAAPDARQFWQSKGMFVSHLPYFREQHDLLDVCLPQDMGTMLGHLISKAELQVIKN